MLNNPEEERGTNAGRNKNADKTWQEIEKERLWEDGSDWRLLVHCLVSIGHLCWKKKT
jgi:hypothetical protein